MNDSVHTLGSSSVEDAMVVQEKSGFDKDVEICNKKGKHKTVASSSSRHPKKLKKSTGERMVDALTAIASTVSSLVEQKKETYNSLKSINVVEALDAIPDLEENIYMDACDLLEDEGKAKIFVSLDVSKKKACLIRKLRTKISIDGSDDEEMVVIMGTNVTAIETTYYYEHYISRTPCRDSALSSREYIKEILNGHD
ncbi:hypothetical protein F0562_025770 [Nyssa sinensis]|uniref:Uncharacterized protein n=1 Tax=Nyssa sinensis TaxID=561372 RepID=A0A5J5B912_9ASTE|nr:hypothetical protein F0562_025770 [Nyssa sinensis]